MIDLNNSKLPLTSFILKAQKFVIFEAGTKIERGEGEGLNIYNSYNKI